MGPPRSSWKGRRLPNPRVSLVGVWERARESWSANERQREVFRSSEKKNEREGEEERERNTSSRRREITRDAIHGESLVRNAHCCVSASDSYGPQATLSQYRGRSFSDAMGMSSTRIRRNTSVDKEPRSWRLAQVPGAPRLRSDREESRKKSFRYCTLRFHARSKTEDASRRHAIWVMDAPEKRRCILVSSSFSLFPYMRALPAPAVVVKQVLNLHRTSEKWHAVNKNGDI